MVAAARVLVTLMLSALLIGGCERVHLFGSGGSNSKPDVGVGVEF